MRNTDPTKLARRQDPHTSHAGAKDVAPRSGSQKAKLLEAYANHPDGLTDEEAGVLSGLANNHGCGYWKRCSDLEREGLIQRTLFTRPASTGNQQIVRAITETGRKVVGK